MSKPPDLLPKELVSSIKQHTGLLLLAGTFELRVDGVLELVAMWVKTKHFESVDETEAEGTSTSQANNIEPKSKSNN